MQVSVASANPLRRGIDVVAKAIGATVADAAEPTALVVSVGGASSNGITALLRAATAGDAKAKSFVGGDNKAASVAVRQWCSLAAQVSVKAVHVAEAEAVAPMAGYLTGATPTAADALLLSALAAGDVSSATTPKLAAWVKRASADATLGPLAPALDDVSPTAAGGGKKGNKVKEAPPTPEEIAARRIAKEKAAAEKAAAKAAAGETDEQKDKKKGAHADPAPLDPCDLDIRVGKILSATKHEKADRLFVETIDCGEAAPRTIVSGLVGAYTAEELTGRSVLVVANMKEKALVGTKSHGMVLCAAAEDKPLTLVAVPAGAAAGTRVTIGGKVADAPPGVTKKITELLAPLRADAAGAVRWAELPLAVNGRELTSPVVNSIVK